jgi:hypothetical protein
LLLTALAVMIVGPRFGAWLAGRIHLSYGFVLLWPTIHWVIAIGFTVLAIEAVYLLGPNAKQRLGRLFRERSWQLPAGSVSPVYSESMRTRCKR